MNDPSYSITLYRTKSRLAEALGISRKTIQRKVAAGELSQDSYGRVRVDELIAILKADSMRPKRGPKIKPYINQYNNIICNYNKGKFKVEILDHDELTIKNEYLDNKKSLETIQNISELSSATLDDIAEKALSISHHKRRLAKLGLSNEASNILKIIGLEIVPENS